MNMKTIGAIRFRSNKAALNNHTNVLAVHLEDDSITDILQSRKIRSILGVEADSDGYITPLSDNTSRPSSSRRPSRARKRGFGRAQSINAVGSTNLSSRSKSETLGRTGRNRTPKRVRSLVNWFERLAAKHQEPETSESRIEVKGLEWKPALHEIMDDVELIGALESFMSRLYCDENLLYLKELRELQIRFGGGAPIGQAHLCTRSSPLFGNRPSVSFLRPGDDETTATSHRPSIESRSRFADDENEETIVSRQTDDENEADDEKSEERRDEEDDDTNPPTVGRTMSLLQSETRDADIDDDEVEVVEQSYEVSVTKSVEYEMTGLFDRDPPHRPELSTIRDGSPVSQNPTLDLEFSTTFATDDVKEREMSPETQGDVERQSSIRIHTTDLPYNVQETAVGACKRLWRDYISSNAYHQVNLSFDTRESIRANIRSLSRMAAANSLTVEDSRVIDIFIDSQKEIEKLIRTDTLSKFYDSPEFIVIANSRPADE